MALLDNYMTQISSDSWSLPGFLEYRKGQGDFSGMKDKEHYRYKMSLIAVQSCDNFTTVEKENAQRCLRKFKNERKRPAEETFIIRPPPNLRNRLSHNNENISLDDYDEYPIYVDDTLNKASPDKTNVAKDICTDRVSFVNMQQMSINSDDVSEKIVTVDVEQFAEEITTEKVEKRLECGYNISRDFREFQMKTIEQLKNKPTLSYATDVDEILCLSSIIYIKEDKPKFMLPKSLTSASLPKIVQLIIKEYSTLLMNKNELNIKWHQNWSKWDPSMTKEEKSSTKNDMDENTFVHRYCHLMFEEVFEMNHLKFLWVNGESISSKERRKSNDNKHGRKPDFRVEVTSREIKPPSASNNVVNQALIKLAEFMKESLDYFHKRYGYSPTSETFGIIIDGSCIRLFSMDIAFDGLYRIKQIGIVLLPTEVANFSTIAPVMASLYSLLKSIDHSIDELNKPFTPTGQSYHRESNSSPQKVQIPILNIT
ncbi:2607_t:CDS:10 [Acaulospora morrowiae]|uniref:2607_t:CDS:1 n=1 Tax=Acaulospora morrowiae TaxID=94023 RepID=A0A9N9A063_9GLOM|nr:2607_t:CDS:10 [Acaulospora morrowiae]